ncbi:MAG: prefoldin subunit alpha [Candidatus Woesearchaeota archaeon]
MNDEKMMELHSINEYLEKLQGQMTKMQENLLELTSITEALASMENFKGEPSAFLPLASGIFIKGTIKPDSTVMMNVGQGVVVEKSINEALTLIEKQKKNLESIWQKADKQFDELVERAQSLQKEIEE